MPPTNDFVPFCNENTGTNLPSQAAYLANPALPIGNQPGVASSSFVNKALRQGTTLASVVAQYLANVLSNDVLDAQNSADHAVPAALVGQATASFKYHSPVVTTYLSGSGNHNLTFKFQIATGSATAAATYSDGTTTYTVKTTVASGTQLDATGGAVPSAASGTLTKLSGTGDATITYYAFRKPLYLIVNAIGGGGGGGGTGTASASAGGKGGDTTFGTFTAAGGNGGGAGTAAAIGAGGTANANSGSPTISLLGTPGTGGYTVSGGFATNTQGGKGGDGAYGGGAGGGNGSAGTAASPNTGGGGSGSGGNTSVFPAGGGASGSYFQAIITSVLATYAYAVGAAGAAGTIGTSGAAGGLGALGLLCIQECYQ